MRISTQQIFNRGIDTIQDVKAQQQNTQLQISSGKKIISPADDPVASTRILELNQELNLNEQFQRNIELAEGELKLQDDLLGSINDVIQRIRDLAVQSGNGALNPDDLQFIGAEVQQRLVQLAGLLNSQDAGGEYVFSGFQGDTEPFVQNSSGIYEYQGDEGRRFVQIEPSVTIASTENGKEIFVDVEASNTTFFTQASSGNQADPPAQITAGQIIDRDLFDALYPEDLTITFGDPTAVVPNGPNFNITESSTGRPVLSNVVYRSDQPIVAAGIQFDIVGDPLQGDTFFVKTTPKQGLLTTVEKFIYALDNFVPTSGGRDVFAQAMDDTIANLDNAETSLLDARGKVGARLNTLDTTDEQLKDVEILTKETLSKLEEVDYAEAVSLLSLQTFTLEAAFSSFAQVTRLTLFDVI